MKIISITAQNFGSYKSIDFDFQNKGLTLIQGPTGSGKSTLCDLVPWALFGVTAKNGNADEVLNWTAEGPTGAIVSILNKGQTLKIYRSRNSNDLYYTTTSSLYEVKHRGKDLKDTQKMINELLGFDETLYLSGAYFHEFSQVAQFFTTTPKARRSLTDQLVDLSTPQSLQNKAIDEIKAITKERTKADSSYTSIVSKIEYIETLIKNQDNTKNKYLLFEDSRAERIKRETARLLELTEAIQPTDKFKTTEDRLKEKLSLASKDTCPTCGGYKKSKEREEITASLHMAEKRRLKNEEFKRSANVATISLKNIELEANPYEQSLLDLETRAEELQVLTKQATAQGSLVQNLDTKLADLELLKTSLLALRSSLIQNTIVRLQDTTNAIISEHFDGELSINLSIEVSDKLDVEIAKDGNICVYTQLSKGQRQILKLAFGIAVMKAIGTQHSLSFDTLFFDEALDGLDDRMKLKALGLFNKLSLDYTNIFVVEHSSELKAHFENKLTVTVKNGYSEINE